MAAILADDIFKRNFVNENALISIKKITELYSVQLTIRHHWFRYEQVTSPYLNQ